MNKEEERKHKKTLSFVALAVVHEKSGFLDEYNSGAEGARDKRFTRRSQEEILA